MNTFPEYRYKGASALVKLHEIHLQSFYETWKQAKQLNVKLPDSDDPYYKSLDTLLYHLLRSARGYMIWMCDKLGLEDPQIKETPPAEIIEEKLLNSLYIYLNDGDFLLRMLNRNYLRIKHINPIGVLSIVSMQC